MFVKREMTVVPHLYFTQSNLKLGVSDGRLEVVNTKDGSKRSFPIATVTDISVFGQPQISTRLVRECLSRDIPIAYYSDDGHYFGHISSSMRIDPVRQKRQVYLTDDPKFCLGWSKQIIRAKLLNSLALLGSDPETCEFSDEDLRGLLHSFEYLDSADSVDMVLGFEGNAARNYFACLPKLLRNEDFVFKGRSSRPPKDPFNSMLSFGYSLLYRDIIGAIERHGLHPYFAFMHKIGFGHAALASDLIEEYRAPLVDRTVLQMVNDDEVRIGDFYQNAAGAIYMNPNVSRKFTNRMSEIMAKSERYFAEAGENKAYGFQAMLDKKLDQLLVAMEKRDPSLYTPYVWRPE